MSRGCEVADQGQHGGERWPAAPGGAHMCGPRALHEAEVGEQGVLWMEEGLPWAPRWNEVFSFCFPAI